MSNLPYGSINDFLQDNIIYRNLIPYNDSLPTFSDYKKEIKENKLRLPRKTDPLYAETIIYLLNKAHQDEEIKNLIFIGDTIMNDGGAFQNIIKYSNWNGYCFICDEKPLENESFNREQSDYGVIYKSNRWKNLENFENELKTRNFFIDNSTVLLIDMDKTMVGARGRNDLVIDSVRLEAAQMLLNQFLYLEKEDSLFKKIYTTLNAPSYHHFTKDNQDYLVYICLIIRSGFLNSEEIFELAMDKDYKLEEFINSVENQKEKLTSKIQKLHSEFYHFYNLGDPTPFKEFRKSEYLVTSEKFIQSKNKNIKEILESQIVITGEVYNFAIEAKKAGALVFGLSDKPDEASIPSKEQMSNGLLPLHQLSTTIIEGGML